MDKLRKEARRALPSGIKGDPEVIKIKNICAGRLGRNKDPDDALPDVALTQIDRVALAASKRRQQGAHILTATRRTQMGERFGLMKAPRAAGHQCDGPAYHGYVLFYDEARGARRSSQQATKTSAMLRLIMTSRASGARRRHFFEGGHAVAGVPEDTTPCCISSNMA